MSDLDVHLAGIAAGDAEAFAAWMSQAEEPLRRALASFARTVDVEAVLQEVLLRVWQVAPRFEPDGKANGLLRLAHRISRNLAISEVRKRRSTAVDPQVLAAGLDERVRVEARPPDPHLRAIIHECREALPNKPGLALTARLKARGGEHDATLAARLNMKKNTFLQNFTRARRLLLECLGQRGVDVSMELR